MMPDNQNVSNVKERVFRKCIKDF